MIIARVSHLDNALGENVTLIPNPERITTLVRDWLRNKIPEKGGVGRAHKWLRIADNASTIPVFVSEKPKNS